LSTTFHLGPSVAPVKDCSTHPVLDPLSAQDISHVLLHLLARSAKLPEGLYILE